MEVLTITVLAVLGVGAWWAFNGVQWKPLSPDEAEMSQMAAALGVTMVARTSPQIVIDRAELSVWGLRRRRRVVVVVPLQARMPGPFLVRQRDGAARSGAAIGVPSLDARLEVHADGTHPPDDLSWVTGQVTVLNLLRPPEEIAALFNDPDVQDALASLLPADRAGSRVTTAAVHLQQDSVSPRKVRKLLDDAIGLADALDHAADVWGQLAQHFSLPVGPFTEDGDRIIDGELEGFPLQIGPWKTVGAEVFLHVADNTLTLRPTQRADLDAPIALQNPILDSMVVARAPDPARARQILNAPDAIGEVLAVLHAWPDSVVNPGEVRVRSATSVRLEQLVEMVEAGLALAKRLASSP